LVESVRGYSNLAPLPEIGCSERVLPPNGPNLRTHQASKRLGHRGVAQLVADYEAGEPTTALMSKYDLGKGTVLRLLRSQGVDIRHQSLTDDEVQQVVLLYAEGLSLARVGDRFGRDPSFIALVLERAGVPRRNPQGRTL
jgi:hypothetical protein